MTITPISIMKKYNILYWILLLFSSLYAPESMAQGVAAGTVIKNTVLVTYLRNENDTEVQQVEASNSFTVAETINVSVTSLDTPAVVTSTPAINPVLSFQVSNTGNGTETFSLLADDSITGDDFNPVVQTLWIETNGVPGLQNNDTQYQLGINDIQLASDESQYVYVISSIPADLNKDEQGNVNLIAASTTIGADTKEIGEGLTGAGTNNTDAILLVHHGRASSTGVYTISPIQLALSKTVVTVLDPYSRETIVPDSLVTYQINITATGDNGTLDNLVIEDTTPLNMSYVAGSIKFDGNPVSDNVDADNADFGITKENTVTVKLGNVAAPATHTLLITYKIN